MNNFDSVFRKYHPRLLLYSLKYVAEVNDALDIVQNVFVSVWENEKYKLDENFVQAYLFQAVKNSCLNYLKHKKVVLKFEESETLHLKEIEAVHYLSGEKSIIEQENLDTIYKAIDSLSDIYREVIHLSRFEGLKNHEIADRLEIPVRTVETRIFRALHSLKDKLSKKSLLTLLIFSRFRKI